jgi:hypothetical protein
MTYLIIMGYRSKSALSTLHDNRLIEWDVHVTKSLGAYDMIIGRDLLEFLGIDVKFSDMTVEWGNASMPFKKYDSTVAKSYHINDPVSVEERTQRVKEILEAKYMPADLEQICSSCTHLQIEQQKKLLDLLQKNEDLFDGSLGKWNSTEVNIELKEGATPYHAKAYPIPKCHLETLKMARRARST